MTPTPATSTSPHEVPTIPWYMEDGYLSCREHFQGMSPHKATVYRRWIELNIPHPRYL